MHEILGWAETPDSILQAARGGHADSRTRASFVNEPDTRLNPSGVKGRGEVAMVGVAPAIANAVYHATGKRVRHLPIRIEDLFQVRL